MSEVREITRLAFEAQPYNEDAPVGEARKGAIQVNDEARWGVARNLIDDPTRVAWEETDFPAVPRRAVPESLLTVRPEANRVTLETRDGSRTPFTVLIDGAPAPWKNDEYGEKIIPLLPDTVVEVAIRFSGGPERLVITFRPRWNRSAPPSDRIATEPWEPEQVAEAAARLRETWWVPRRAEKGHQLCARVCAALAYLRQPDPVGSRARSALQLAFGGPSRRNDASKQLADSLYLAATTAAWTEDLRRLRLDVFYLDPSHPAGRPDHKANARWDDLIGLSGRLLAMKVILPEDLPSVDDVLGKGFVS